MLGAAKVVIDRDWLNQDSSDKLNDRSRKIHKFEQMKVTRSEDLPELMTAKDAALFLKRHFRTIEQYRKEGSLRFEKIRGRYYTTPEYIAEFIERETRRR